MPTLAPIRIVIAGVDKFSKEFSQVNKQMKKISGNMTSVGRSMTTGVTLPVVGMGVGIISAAAKFDLAMNKVEAKAEVVGKSLGDLRELAKEMGATTQFSASQAAEGMDFLSMAGFDTEQIYSALPNVLNLAAAADMELGRAADITSNIMGAFNKDAKDTADIVDVLATVTTSANVDMEMLAETMKYAAPDAENFGASLRDTAAAAGFLGNIGIQGSTAGTVMKNMFKGITAGTPKVVKAFKALDIQVKDGNGGIRSFTDILAELSGKLSKMDKVTQMRALEDIFGGRVKGAVGALANDMTKVNSGFAKLSKKLVNVKGNAQTMADTINKGAVGGMRAFMSALEGVAIAIGESGILDMFSDFVRWLAKILRGISKTSPGILKLGTFIAIAVAAIGPLLIIGGKLIAMFASATSAIAGAGGVMALLSNPIGWIIAAFLAVVGVVSLMVAKFDSGFGKIMMVVFPMGGIVAWIIKRWKKIVPFFKLFGLVLGKIFSKIMDGPMGKFFKWIGEKLAWLGEKIQWILDLGLEKLTKLIGKFAGAELMKEAGFEDYQTTPGAAAASSIGAVAGEKIAAARALGRERSELFVDFGNPPPGTSVEVREGDVKIGSDNGQIMEGGL